MIILRKVQLMNIKLPRPHDYQMVYHKKAVKSRFNAVAGGRRAGKTWYALLWLLIMGLQTVSGENIWLAPTLRQAKKIGFYGFLNLIGGFPKSMYDIKMGELSVTVNGRVFYFGSTDSADSARGDAVKNLVMDEAAFHTEYAWKEVVRPSLSDLKGNVLFVTTYKGFNWFYEIMQDETWNRVSWPSALNPLMDEEEINLLRETMDEQAFKQEILAIPTTAKGLVYERVFGEESIIPDSGPRKNDSVAISIDFGYNDPTAVSFYAYHQIDAYRFDTIKFDEISRTGKLLEDIIPEIIKKLQGYNIEPIDIKCAVDIAGKQHTGVSEWSYIERLQEAGIFNVLYKKISKESSINFQRAQFLNANGNRSFKICRRCRKSIESYTAYEIKDNERPFDDSKHDHFPDSDIYFFENIIRPLMAKKEMIRREKKVHGKPEMQRCCYCAKRYITFTGELMCSNCKRKKILEGAGV